MNETFLLSTSSFLGSYALLAAALSLTSITQCWLTDKTTIKKIIWTLAIITTSPLLMLGSIVFAFMHYRTWRKFIPLVIMILFIGIGCLPYNIIEDEVPEDIGLIVARIKYYEDIETGKNQNFIPEQNEPTLYRWAEESFLKIGNLNDENYVEYLESIKYLFTENGYKNYYKALDKVKIIRGLEKKEFDIILQRNNDPIRAYMYDRRYAKNKDERIDWVINVPGKLVYKKTKNETAHNVKCLLTIKEESEGYKIVQVIMVSGGL